MASANADAVRVLVEDGIPYVHDSSNGACVSIATALGALALGREGAHRRAEECSMPPTRPGAKSAALCGRGSPIDRASRVLKTSLLPSP